MMHISINENEKLSCLQKALRLFGLNPQHWEIHELPSGKLLIRRWDEPEPQFLGTAINAGYDWHWREISLVLAARY